MESRDDAPLLDQSLPDGLQSLLVEWDAQRKTGVLEIPPALTERYWRAGVLYYKLDGLQQRIHDHFYSEQKSARGVAMISRRCGKTFTYACIAIQTAIRKPRSRQYYVASTKYAVENMLKPICLQILADCPEDLRPVWHTQKSRFLFPNGSEIIMGGVEDEVKANRLRGAFADNFFIDEAGYVPGLSYVVDSVAMPMLKGREGAKLWLYSNAPKDPSHDIVGFINRAAADGTYFFATIYDSPQYSPQQIKAAQEQSGGEDSTTWKREYLCEIVVDEEYAIFPEFTPRADRPWVQVPRSFRARPPDPHAEEPEDIRLPLIRSVDRPAYYDTYTAMDLGWAPDLTAIIAYYWDYREARMVIVGERELYKMTTNDLAAAVEGLERETWGDYWKFLRETHGEDNRKPFRRWMDVDRQIQHDLGALHGLHFTQINNRDLHSQINQARQAFRAGKIVIEPHCTKTIAHLKAGHWNQQRSKFARPSHQPKVGEAYFGHFDFCSAVQIGYSNIVTTHDPYPDHAVEVSPSTHRIRRPLGRRKQNAFQALGRTMRRTKRRH